MADQVYIQCKCALSTVRSVAPILSMRFDMAYGKLNDDTIEKVRCRIRFEMSYGMLTGGILSGSS